MADWIETEIKLGLPDAHAWQRIRDQLGAGKVLHQANHFLDVPSQSFRQARIGIRLRAEENARLVTAKGHSDGPVTSVSRRIELESPVALDEFDRALRSGLELRPWILSWRKRFGSSPEAHTFIERLESLSSEGCLSSFGHFNNRREIFPLVLATPEGPLRLELELDRTEFPGGRVDYEVEVERTEERDGSMKRTHRALIQWFEETLEIQTFSVEGKLSRFNAILDASLSRFA
jgi:uncharacterized protein YjbK